jgi:ribosomal-protein-serine acetyltransferase
MREQLSDDRIAIKKIIPEYIPLLFQAAFESRDRLKTWLPWCHSNYNIEETKDWANLQQIEWNDRREFSFGIFELDSNRFVGGCGINQINWIHKIGNVGYWIRTDATGNGYASAAAKLCAKFGFMDVKLSRIEIVTAKENLASQRAAEKTGAVRECLARKRLMVGDITHDAFVYSLIKEDIVKE